MQYTQSNPLPIPAGGAYQTASATVDTVFDWRYGLEQQGLLALYEKGKNLSWNANDLDWSIDVDIEKLRREQGAGDAGASINQFLNPPTKITDAQAVDLNLNMNAYMLSQFLHGEQGALLAAAKIVQTIPETESKFYAANQVADEARHVEVYHRYLTEKLGLSYSVNPNLRSLLDDIICDSRWDVTFLGMQIMVEGLALAAFSVMRMMMAGEPLIGDITGRILTDESRHVAFGVVSLEKIYRDGLTSAELAEREEFVIESTYLLRERLMFNEVFERMDWDVDVWTQWADTTPFMIGFRQMMFSKIVPNLKRLGLLTPRVREAYGKMGILQYEDCLDSIEEPEPQPPIELVTLLMEALNAAPAGAPGAAPEVVAAGA